MLGAAPIRQHFDTGQKFRQFSAGGRWMRGVNPGQQERWHRAIADKRPAHAEDERMVPHIVAECGNSLRVQVRPSGELFLGPLGVAVREVFGVFRMQPNRILQYRAQDRVSALSRPLSDRSCHRCSRPGRGTCQTLGDPSARCGRRRRCASRDRPRSRCERHRRCADPLPGGKAGIRQRLGPVDPGPSGATRRGWPHLPAERKPPGANSSTGKPSPVGLVVNLSVWSLQYGIVSSCSLTNRLTRASDSAQEQPPGFRRVGRDLRLQFVKP